jgi:hypothetical protein
LADIVRSDPAAHHSRLLCLRRLVERCDYELFLVPTFAAGRAVGLGQEHGESWDAPAWTSTTEPVELPYYFRSRFVTSAREDFELQVRRLRPAPADGIPGLGDARLASAADPGYYRGYSAAGRTFAVQTALRRPGTGLPAYDTDPQLATRLASTLSQVIAGEAVAQDGPGEADPLVAMPAYGWRFRQETSVDETRVGGAEWFNRLNLDLKLRQAAGLGAETVRGHQEELMAAAWEQYEGIVAANRALGRLGLADRLTRRVSARRLRALPAEVVMALQTPLHEAVRSGDETISELLSVRGIPSSFASIEMRQLAARRPVRLIDDGDRPRAYVPAPGIPGDTTPDLRVRPGPNPSAPVDGTLAQALARAETNFFCPGAFTTARPQQRAQRIGSFASDDVATSIIDTLKVLPRAKADMRVRGRSEAEADALAPVLRSPRIGTPLIDWLLALDHRAVLQGAEAIPDNTVTLVQENRAFVEAHLVGANHALNNELRWREFPTDMRGTVLARFWDRGYADADPRGDDIPDIDRWTKHIGRNFLPTDAGDADLVLLIKGDIVRKLGAIVVVLNRATDTTWRLNQGTDLAPVFNGLIGPDTAYFGFDVPRAEMERDKTRFFFVLHEPLGRLRFGVDVATAETRRTRFRADTASMPFPLAGSKDRGLEVMPGRRFTAPAPPVAAGLSTWDDLSASHLTWTEADYLHVDATAVSVTTGPDLWGPNRTSASIARSIWQRPVAAVLPARRVL